MRVSSMWYQLLPVFKVLRELCSIIFLYIPRNSCFSISTTNSADHLQTCCFWCVCAWPWFNKRLGKYRNVGCQMEWTLWPFWIIVNECLTSFCIAMEILSLLFDLATAVTVLIIPELTLKDLYFISRATAFALVFVSLFCFVFYDSMSLYLWIIILCFSKSLFIAVPLLNTLSPMSVVI